MNTQPWTSWREVFSDYSEELLAGFTVGQLQAILSLRWNVAMREELKKRIIAIVETLYGRKSVYLLDLEPPESRSLEIRHSETADSLTIFLGDQAVLVSRESFIRPGPWLDHVMKKEVEVLALLQTQREKQKNEKRETLVARCRAAL